MLSRLSLGRPQFIPSASGHWELDPRSRSRGGYCSPAEQKRKGSGGETQQSGAPKRRAPPSIHPSLRRDGAGCFPAEKTALTGLAGTRVPGTTPLLPRATPGSSPTCSISAVSPTSLPGSGGRAGRAAGLPLTLCRK